MLYIDKEEASRILGQELSDPVYKQIREDADGSKVAVPVFRIEEKIKKVRLKKKCARPLFLFMEIVIFMALIWLAIILTFGLTVYADVQEFEYIEQTESQEVIELTEAIAKIYPICPELLQALIFYESSNQRTVISHWGDVGYMQINPRWNQERMQKLGVTDLEDGYSNILVGADYLCELFKEYEDPALVLMCYNQGEEKALGLYNANQISEYASKILELSEQLEELHGKHEIKKN